MMPGQVTWYYNSIYHIIAILLSRSTVQRLTTFTVYFTASEVVGRLDTVLASQPKNNPSELSRVSHFRRTNVFFNGAVRGWHITYTEKTVAGLVMG